MSKPFPVLVTSLAAALLFLPTPSVSARQVFEYRQREDVLAEQQAAARVAAGMGSMDVYNGDCTDPETFKSEHAVFDAAGRVTRTTTFYDYMTVEHIQGPLVTEWDHDAYGDEAAMRQFDGRGCLLDRRLKTYDPSGLVTSEIWSDTGYGKNYILHAYDRAGRLVKTVRRNSREPVTIDRLTYDGRGRATLRSGGTGRPGEGYALITFDADGYEVRRETWKPGERRPATTIDYTFDPSHRLLSVIHRDARGAEFKGERNTFDERGTLVEYVKWDKPANYHCHLVNRFDRLGRLVRTDFSENASAWKSVYEYDPSGLLKRDRDPWSAHTYRYFRRRS